MDWPENYPASAPKAMLTAIGKEHMQVKVEEFRVK